MNSEKGLTGGVARYPWAWSVHRWIEGENPVAPCWVHSDLMPSNLPVTEGRLTAVIDFATVGVGDPACDLVPAWNLLPSSARATFRAAVQVDDATWTRGRGWALSMAVIQLPYYRNTNPIISANARHVIREITLGSGSDRRPEEERPGRGSGRRSRTASG